MNIAEKTIQIEEFINFGSIKEASEIIKEWENKKENSHIEEMEIKILKIKLYNTISKYHKAMEISNELLLKSKKHKNLYYEFCSIIEILRSLGALNKITKAFIIIRLGNIILKEIERKNDNNYLLLKAKFFLRIAVIYQKSYQYQESLRIHNKSFVIFNKLDNLLGMSESLYNIGLVYTLINKFEEGLDQFNKSIDISCKFKPNMVFAWANLHKAMAIYQMGNHKGIIEAINEGLKISKLFKNIHAEDFAYTIMSIHYYRAGELVLALKNQKKSYKLRKIRGNSLEIAYSLCTMAQIYCTLGNIEKAYKNIQKVFLISEAMKDSLAAPLSFSIYGEILAEKGNFSDSIIQFRKALKLFENTNEFNQRLRNFHFLIWMMIIQEKKKETNILLENLKDLSEKFKDNSQLQLTYQLEQGIVYKYSRDTYKEVLAQKIFENLYNKKIVFVDIVIEAIVNNIEIYINEFRLTQKEEFLQKTLNMANKLLNIAKKQKNTNLICETLFLKAKLALRNKKIAQAKLYFINAQKIANKKKIYFLAQKFSDEHDLLLKNIDLGMQKAEIQKKFDIFDFEFMFSKITRNFGFSIPNFNHSPIFLIIWKKLDDKLKKVIFILTEQNKSSKSINLFVNEYILSEYAAILSHKSYERIKIENYLLIKRKIKNFQIDYVFEGSSFIAERKINNLLQKLKKSLKIWNYLYNNINDNNPSKSDFQYCINEVFQQR